MRSRLANIARAALLIGPTLLAFHTGGYFDAPRITAGLIAWAMVVVALIVCKWPLTHRRAALIAIGGLAGLAAWTLLSITWAPVAGSAYHDGQRVVLYTGVLVAALALLRTRGAQRAVEPVLAAGATVVIGYGLAGRLLPGLLHYARSTSAQGRLEQPLTYWNAMGELAAIGLVLAARVAGDRSRPRALRAAAAAAAAVLGMGLYTTFSRGALFACAAGLVTLIVVAPARAQLRALGVTIAAALLAVLAAAPFAGVTGLSGTLSTREREGAIALVLLLVIGALAALTQWRLAGRDPEGSVSLPRHAPWIATAVICAGFAAAVIAGAHESSGGQLAPGATRLASLQSNRYEYWRVALDAFKQEPLRGIGAGGWAVEWLQRRPFNEGAQDAHSLELQTAAELGIVGLALLAAFIGGIAVCARAAVRAAPAVAAGPLAGVVVWLAHSPLDWDWEMPAVTLLALILAGLLLVLAEPRTAPDQPARASRPRRDNPAMPGARPLTVALSLAVCAWFVLGAVQTHNQARATALIQLARNPSPADTARILGLLNTASTLNPDRTIDLLRSEAQTRAGQTRAGINTALAVVRAEPQNADAWVVLGLAARSAEPRLATLAQQRLTQLVPPVPPPP